MEKEAIETSEVISQSTPLLPVHTKQAAKALALLLFFSFLMFSLPFGVFFGTNHILRDYFHIEGYTNTVWSVLAAVVTVNVIIISYAYIAYKEPEYDEDGNIIKEDSRKVLNTKQD